MKSYLVDFSVLTSKLMSSIGFFATLYEDLIPAFPTNRDFPGWRGILARRRVATLRLDQVCQAVEPEPTRDECVAHPHADFCNDPTKTHSICCRWGG